MPDRRSFLTKLGVTGILLAAASPAGAQTATQAPATPLPPPEASPVPSGTPEKGPSAVAVAVAATMRRFDPKLDDAELRTIAAGIDDIVGAGAALNPKGRRLKNSDEPVTHFSAGPR